MQHVRMQVFVAFVFSFFAAMSHAAANVEEAPGWMSTASNYSLTVNPSLFSPTTFQDQAVLRAVASGASIHSHYTGSEPSSTACEYSGRMFKGVSTAGIGVTFASKFPTSAAYYRLGTSASGGQYVLTPYSSTGKAAPVGNLYSGVTPAVSTWTRFKIRWESRSEAIYIRAKVWADGAPEPTTWQIYAEDFDQNRFEGCRVGVWSNNGGGQNYWDQLTVTSLDKIDDYVLSQNEGLESLSYMWAGSVLNNGNPLYPNSGGFQYKANNGNFYIINASTSSLHNHFIEALPSATSCTYSGSFKKTKDTAGFGVTFASSYPSSNKYYALRSSGAGSSFKLFAAPDGTKSLPVGKLDSAVIPSISRWYSYKVQWETTAENVRIRAKVWDLSSQEPIDWQIDAEDSSSTRYTNCRVGLWSNGATGNYWDNIQLAPLPVTTPINHPPAITSNPVTQVNDTQTYSYQVTAADSDSGDALTYALMSAPRGMTISSTGLIEWQPQYTDVGVHQVALRVSDQAGLSQQQDYSLTVAHVNRSPQITSTPVTNSVEGGIYTYQVVAQDLEKSSLHYALINGPSAMSIDGITGLIQWEPSFKDGGLVAITVRVVDSEGAYSEQNFELNVANVNRAPQFISPPHLYATEGQAYLYFPYVVDPDLDRISYSLASAPVGMSINPGSGFVSWIPLLDAQGQQLVTIVATDSHGASATQSFILFVENFNVAPEIDSVPEQLAFEGEEYQYQIIARDLEGQPLSYSLVVAPSGMTIAPTSGQMTWTPSYESTGAHPVSVLVTDYEGAKSQQNFLVFVSEVNREPAFASEPVAIAIEGRSYIYQILVSDPDKNDEIQLSLGDAPVGMLLGDNDRTLVWDNPRIGTYPVSLTLSDRAGSMAEQTFVLHVVPDDSSGSTGREFFLTFPPNNVNVNQPQISLAIVSEKPTSGFVHIPELNFFTKYVVAPGRLTSISLPSAVQFLQENTVGNLGVRVVAKEPVTLYGVNHLNASTDGFLAIPSSSLGKEYLILSYKDGVAPSRFSVIATEDNTTVTIKNSTNATPFTVSLDKYQTYLSNRSSTLEVAPKN